MRGEKDFIYRLALRQSRRQLDPRWVSSAAACGPKWGVPREMCVWEGVGLADMGEHSVPPISRAGL